ncbi:hypothetical protein BGX24_005687, partial [Mortierella sp. AD032]
GRRQGQCHLFKEIPSLCGNAEPCANAITLHPVQLKPAWEPRDFSFRYLPRMKPSAEAIPFDPVVPVFK